MKKLFVLASAMLMCYAGMASIPTNVSPNAKGEGIICKKISIGTKNARMVLLNDEKLVMPLDQLESYQLGNTLFEKKELFSDGKPTGRFAYMQLVKTKDGMSLYKKVVTNPEIVNPGEIRYEYFIYKGDKLYLAANGKALPNVLNFFGLKWSYE